MAVILTSPVYGKQPGDTYTGADEDYLLASGYAERAGYSGPGVANTGPADTTIAKNVEFRADQAATIAETSDLPFRGTNDGIKTKPTPEPQVAWVGRG